MKKSLHKNQKLIKRTPFPSYLDQYQHEYLLDWTRRIKVSGSHGIRMLIDQRMEKEGVLDKYKKRRLKK
jgi:hypothetical protein